MFAPNFRQKIRDFHRRARGFGPAIDFIFETTCLRLVFVMKSEYCINYRHAVLYGDVLQGIGNRAT